MTSKVLSIDMILTSQSVSLFFLVRLTLSENYTIYYVAKIVWIFAVPASNRKYSTNAMVGWCCPMPIFIVGEYTKLYESFGL